MTPWWSRGPVCPLLMGVSSTPGDSRAWSPGREEWGAESHPEESGPLGVSLGGHRVEPGSPLEGPEMQGRGRGKSGTAGR